ncbi:dienelactone hydrolase family protein [Metabacillus halosaccharovorans]|uniref:dienelactone hydrolase family protein n=1 Tax=Metabacillus halosaccharovorans TaxID=930124 RepID=UPI001FE6D786|nr:alpha/beta fold hydrolase [Metabacillus halosaccharovorans]
MRLKHQNSEAVIIVIHEIYGINLHIEEVCKSLYKAGYDVICPDLLGQEEAFEYSQADEAYRNFISNIGFSKASDIMTKLLVEVKGNYQKVFIVGFSVGATIAWLCSDKESVSGVVGYYGSRIRDFLDVVPLCPTILIFPQEEQSFDVDKLISSLEEKKIPTYKFNGYHGFSDPYSTNYHSESSKNAYNRMIDFLIEH